jgi:manganese/zinc/iron transport system ATP- binding protein
MVIRVSGLTVTHSGSEPALRDVNLEFGRGEMVLLMGPNGAGKSTLIKAIIGIVRPSAGRVEVLGSDPLKDRRVRRRIAYVPQVRSLTTLAPLRVKDLVEMGALLSPDRVDFEGDVESRIRRALEAVGLAERINHRLSQLSGGQLARALMARVLAQNPEIYLLDEPFESIDAASETMILRVLKSERDRGKLVVVTEHHITDFSSFDRAVLLNRTVISSGRPEDVLRHLSLVANVNEGER